MAQLAQIQAAHGSAAQARPVYLQMNTARLIAFGDSWTWGSELRDPSVQGPREDFDPRDDQWRQAHAWPAHLGNLLARDSVINLGRPACSNDTILRTLTEWLATSGHLQGHGNPKDLVVIGWTSPERKDFWFYDSDDPHCPDQGWLTMYPMWTHTYQHAAINRFSYEYVSYWWHAAEYMHRYINTLHRAQQLLDSVGLDYCHFQAIYHHHAQLIDQWNDQQYQAQHSHSISDADRLLWQQLHSNRFLHKDQARATFHNHILAQRSRQDVLMISHPNELGHEIWAEHLAAFLT
jgi:hypothetical protein